MKDKNILYIGGFELPNKNAAAQRVVSNGKLFSELGFNIFYLGINKLLKFSNKYVIKINSKNNFEVGYPNKLFDWVTYLVSIKWIKELYKIELNSELHTIVAYNYPAVGLWRLQRYCKKNKIHLVADVTEWYVAEGNIFYRIIKSFDTLLRMRWIQKRLNGVIVISKYLFRYYSNTINNVLLLPPLVDLKNSKWKSVEKIDTKSIQLIYAGSSGKGQKDQLDIIINSLSKLEGKFKFNLNIIGLSEKEYLDDFNQTIIPQNIKNKILFMGRLTHNNTLEEIKKSDYFVFFRESNLVTQSGFPTKFVEAISCGIPVLTNKSSDLKDYLIEAKNGYFLDPTDSKELLVQLGRLLEKSKLEIQIMKDFCEKSYQFDYHNYLNETKSFFSKL